MTVDSPLRRQADDDPVHIASAVVLARPGQAGQVARLLAAVPGVEVHGDGDDGRMVVSVEGRSHRAVADTLMSLRDTEGVISSELVYQYSDGEAANDPIHEEKVS